MQFGSHVYGTNLPTSDHDIKAVHIPRAEDILLQRAKGSVQRKTNTTAEKNTAADTDFESFSLQRFMGLLLEGQTVALNMLFTPDRWLLESSDLWERIRAERQHWLHRGVSAFIGYCRQQAAKYGIRGSRVATVRAALHLLDVLGHDDGNARRRLEDFWDNVEEFARVTEHASVVVEKRPNGADMRMLDVCGRKIQETMTLKDARFILGKIMDNYGQRALAAEQNQGVDWKAIQHAVRVCGEAEELLLYHTITYPRPEAADLLKIRQGQFPYPVVSQVLEDRMARLEEYLTISTLPEEPDFGRAEGLVLEVYREEVNANGLYPHGEAVIPSLADP